MEIQLRQRLIGAVVIAALVVIFLPLLFKNHSDVNDRSGVDSVAVNASPSASPQLASQTLATNQSSIVGTDISAAQPMVSPSATLVSTSSDQWMAMRNMQMTPVAMPVDIQNENDESTVSGESDDQIQATQDNSGNVSISYVKNRSASAVAQPKKPVKARTTVIRTPIEEAATQKISSGKTWVVQLGSFASKGHVKTLVKELEAKGFSVHSQPVKTSIGTLMRVYVGPEKTKTTAESAKAKINKMFKITGIVESYRPAEKA